MHFKYDRDKYPTRPIYTKNVDKEGREYFVCYSNQQGHACVSLGNEGGVNYIYDGNVKLTYRKGYSSFGNELIFELLVERHKEKTPKRTKYETIEIYLQADKAIEFLKNALKHISEND